MSLATFFTPAPSIRPMFNIGCGFDIPTGVYYTGQHGESILNGGVPHIVGVVGRGNTGKSMIADFQMLSVMDRYGAANAIIRDEEMSKTRARFTKLCERFDNLKNIDLFESGRMILTDATQMNGELWYDALKQYLNDKRKNTKGLMKTTPFFFKEEAFKAIQPTMAMMDSFSQWLPSNIVAMHDKSVVGSSDLNVEAMRAGSARSQLMSQLPSLTGSTGCYIFLTGHLGDEIVMDQHAPSKKKLGYLKGEQKLKRLPENFTFLTNNLWVCLRLYPMKKSGSKELEYPIGLAADSEGDTDLSIIEMQSLRGKQGNTGRIMDIIVSQSDGVLPHLTQFHYIKEGDRWGLGGNVQNYFLELCPDVALSRTVIRRKIDDNPKLRRALEISAEMLQLKELWSLSPGLMCTPKELYDSLKAKGYDWDRLLNTRGYWMFEEDITGETLPFLSTMDLLKMKAGAYHPWWYGELGGTGATPVAARLNLSQDFDGDQQLVSLGKLETVNVASAVERGGKVTRTTKKLKDM
jgi:hypothetical protein